MSIGILEVSDLNDYVKLLLYRDPLLNGIRLRGEIGSLKRHYSGHLYFVLKDDQCQINATMWRSDVQRLSFSPRDGQRVIVTGDVTLYSEQGKYQIICSGMRPEGKGSIYEQFEALKRRFEAEGLFDEERKRPLPTHPQKIAVITAESGAVIHDICRVAAHRDPGMSIMLIPVSVQGAGAAQEIAQALRYVSNRCDIDAVIVGRGGGSMEDLWCFNEECVVRAIATCRIPVISAVGHQTDFTLSDFAADLRAATPSNAAQLLTENGRRQHMEHLQAIRQRMDDAVDFYLHRCEIRKLQLQQKIDRQSPENQIQQMQSILSNTALRFERCMEKSLSFRESRLPILRMRLNVAAEHALHNYVNRYQVLEARLKNSNPQRILGMGYAMVSDGDRMISSAAEAGKHEVMTLTFKDGQIVVNPSSHQETTPTGV